MSTELDSLTSAIVILSLHGQDDVAVPGPIRFYSVGERASESSGYERPGVQIASSNDALPRQPVDRAESGILVPGHGYRKRATSPVPRV